MATRIVIAVIGVISIILALDPPDLIFTLIMFAIAIVTPLFSVLVIGLIESTVCMIVVSLITNQPESDSAAFFEALGDGVMDYEED